jgi:hypothetical protein
MRETGPPRTVRISVPDGVRRWLARRGWDDQKLASEISRICQVGISAMIVVVVAIGVVYNLPGSAIRRAASPFIDPIALSAGLDQNWSVFAPNPPTRQEDVEVDVAMASGTDKVWTLPRLDPVFGVSLSHRWRKFKESLLNSPQIRSDFVHWVVRQLTGPGDHAVHVEMLLRTEDIPPPGVREPGRSALQTLYSENLTRNR